MPSRIRLTQLCSAVIVRPRKTAQPPSSTSPALVQHQSVRTALLTFSTERTTTEDMQDDPMRAAHNDGQHDDTPPSYGQCAQCDWAADGEYAPDDNYGDD